MSERLTLQDLVDLLSDKQNVTKKDAETFLRELVALISETIEQKDFVRIKDFGTFKLTPVSARKSVDVNTGAAIEIRAHYKLSFTPDKILREGVNRPFSHFESILLDDEVTFEDKIQVTVEAKQTIKPTVEPKQPEPAKIIEKVIEPILVQPEPKVETPKLVEVPVAVPVVSVEVPVEVIVEVPIEANLVSKILVDLPEIEVLEELVTESDLLRDEELANLSAFITKETEEEKVQPEKIEDKEPIEPSVKQPEAVPPTPRKAALKYDDDDDDDDEFVDYEFIAQQRKQRNTWIGIGVTIIVLCVFGIFGYNYYASGQSDTVPYAQDNAKVTISDEKPVQQPIVAAEPLADSTDKKVVEVVPNKVTPAAEVPVATTPVESKPTVTTPSPTTPKPATGSKEVEVRSGQTMRALGQEYFGNSSFWVYIFEENRSRIKSPDAVFAGMKLIIPPASKYEIDPNDKLSVKKAQKQEVILFREFKAK